MFTSMENLPVPTDLMGDGPGTKPMDTTGSKKADRPPWWIFVVFLALAFLLLTLYGWSLRSASVVLIEMLLGLASASAGGLIGFLFGLPKTTSNSGTLESPSGTEKPPYEPSNNLELVSEWLTKILIGVGLVELRELKVALAGIGALVATSFPWLPGGAGIVSQVVVVSFSIAGFLSCFLWTRIYYGLIQAMADWKAIDALRSKFKRDLKVVGQELSEQATKSLQTAEVVKRLARGDLATQQRPTALTISADEVLAADRPDSLAWPEGLSVKYDKFMTAPTEWESDPSKEIFGALPKELNGRQLEAEILTDMGDALVLAVRVRRTSGDPMLGQATFLLHPTLRPRVKESTATNDVAEISVFAEGWFTVVAIIDDGKTILSYPLNTLPGAPRWFLED